MTTPPPITGTPAEILSRIREADCRHAKIRQLLERLYEIERIEANQRNYEFRLSCKAALATPHLITIEHRVATEALCAQRHQIERELADLRVILMFEEPRMKDVEP